MIDNGKWIESDVKSDRRFWVTCVIFEYFHALDSLFVLENRSI